jgi:peptidoglycan hydrolase CwlO-like protein
MYRVFRFLIGSMMVIPGFFVLFSIGPGIEVDASPAVASGWSEPEMICLDHTDDLYSYKLDVDDDGNAIAIWSVRIETDRYVIYSNYYTFENGWGTPERIDSHDSIYVVEMDVKFDTDGDALAVYTKNDGGTLVIRSIDYSKSEGWGDVESVPGSSKYGGLRPTILMSEGGIAMIIYTTIDDTSTTLQSSRHIEGAGWQAQEYIENEETMFIGGHKAAGDPSSSVIAIWEWYDTSHIYDIMTNLYDPIYGWGTPRSMKTSPALDSGGENVDMDSSGNAVATWVETDGSEYFIRSAKYGPDTGWGNAILVERSSSNIGLGSIEMDEAGSAHIIYDKMGTSVNDIWYVEYSLAQGLGTPVNVEDCQSTTFVRSLSVEPGGDLMISWSQTDGGRDEIYVNIFTKAKGWSGPTMIENRNGNSFNPIVDNSGSGTFIVLWLNNGLSVGGTYSLWASIYNEPDVSPPVLEIESPPDRFETTSPSVIVSGTAEAGCTLSVNGILFFVGIDGSFSGPIPLDTGINYIIVTATDGSGNVNSTLISVIYNDPVFYLTDALSNVISNLTALETDMGALREDLDSLEGIVYDLEDVVSAQKNNITTIERDLSYLYIDMDSISSEIAGLNAKIAVLRSELENLTNDVDNISFEVNLSSVYKMIDALEKKLNATGTDLEDLSEEIGSAKAELDDVSSTLESMKGEKTEETDTSGLETWLIVLTALVVILGILVVVLAFARGRSKSKDISDE